MSEPRLTVALSSDFLKALNKLPEKGRSKAASFVSKFRDNPRSTGLNYERIEGGKDPMIRSLRVDQDIRCIVRAPEEGYTYGCFGSISTTTPINGPGVAPAMSTGSMGPCRWSTWKPLRWRWAMPSQRR